MQKEIRVQESDVKEICTLFERHGFRHALEPQYAEMRSMRS